MWAIDWAHPCNGYSVSWIEAGEGTGAGKTTPWYFWADCRPGYNYAQHWLYQVPSGDFGQFFAYTIVNTSNWGTSQGTWDLSMQSLNGTQHWLNGLHTSTAMSFKPNDIEVGLEIYPFPDPAVGSANPADYTQNQWRNSSGVWAYQNSAGSPHSDPTAFWTWLTVPAPGGVGGYGEATCC
jgi:hypothetical protein